MAAISVGAFQERRRRALLRPLRPRRGIAPDVEFHAKKIWCPDIRAWFADGARIEIGDLSGADAVKRNQRRALSRARRTSVRLSGRAFPRDDRGGRRRNAQSRRETRFRKS